MQHIPDMRIGNTHVHGNKLGKEMNRIKDQSLYASANKLFGQLLQRYPGPLRMHLLKGVADDILSLEHCQMRIHCRRSPDGYSSSPNGTKSRPALWTMRAASGRPKNVTSCPRACILRPKAVIGCKCPVS
jgi:hypothetical protein